MSTQALSHVHVNGLVQILDDQFLALAGIQPRQLVIYSADRRGPAAGRWERAWEDALFLRTVGAAVDGEEIAEAVAYALDHCGVERILLIGETGYPADGVDASRPERGTPFMERIAMGVRRHREQLDAAKDRIRHGVATLRKSSEDRARIHGIVEVGEGGALLGYDEVGDDFVAIG